MSNSIKHYEYTMGYLHKQDPQFHTEESMKEIAVRNLTPYFNITKEVKVRNKYGFTGRVDLFCMPKLGYEGLGNLSVECKSLSLSGRKDVSARISQAYDYVGCFTYGSANRGVPDNMSVTSTAVFPLNCGPDQLAVTESLMASFGVCHMLIRKPSEYNEDGNKPILCSGGHVVWDTLGGLRLPHGNVVKNNWFKVGSR